MKLLIISVGFLGDNILAGSFAENCKKAGYERVDLLIGWPQTLQVLKNNPNIDKYIFQERDAVPGWELNNYIEYLGKDYQKHINLCGSVEDRLLYVPKKVGSISIPKEIIFIAL